VPAADAILLGNLISERDALQKVPHDGAGKIANGSIPSKSPPSARLSPDGIYWTGHQIQVEPHAFKAPLIELQQLISDLHTTVPIDINDLSRPDDLSRHLHFVEEARSCLMDRVQ